MRENYILVGLGNPGPKYKETRHNAGFMVVDRIASDYKSKFKFKSWQGYQLAEIETSGHEVVLAKPMTYMNRSGDAVLDLVDNYDIPLSNLLVILDDFNLPFGKLRVRRKGSDGGQNGLASVISSLQSEAFPRLRVGIGHEKMNDTVDFVLSEFDREEKDELPFIIKRAAEASLSFIAHGMTETMNKFNIN